MLKIEGKKRGEQLDETTTAINNRAVHRTSYTRFALVFRTGSRLVARMPKGRKAELELAESNMRRECGYLNDG